MPGFYCQQCFFVNHIFGCSVVPCTVKLFHHGSFAHLQCFCCLVACFMCVNVQLFQQCLDFVVKIFLSITFLAGLYCPVLYNCATMAVLHSCNVFVVLLLVSCVNVQLFQQCLDFYCQDFFCQFHFQLFCTALYYEIVLPWQFYTLAIFLFSCCLFHVCECSAVSTISGLYSQENLCFVLFYFSILYKMATYLLTVTWIEVSHLLIPVN